MNNNRIRGILSHDFIVVDMMLLYIMCGYLLYMVTE